MEVTTLRRVAAKLHELGARILGLEAGDVRGDVVNLLVRFRVMDIWQSTSVDTRF